MQTCRGWFLLSAIALFCCNCVKATPYNPHVPAENQRWFEGWYTRVTTNSGLSLAAVTGSFPDQALPHPAAFAGILFQPQDGGLKSFQALSQNIIVKGPEGQPVNDQPTDLGHADFSLQAEDRSCNLTVNDLTFSMSVAAEDALLTIKGEGPIVPWGPNGETPEGTICCHEGCHGTD